MAVEINFRGPAAASPAAESFRKSFAAGRLHHALLFTGPEGCGKTALAVEAALALLCTGPASRPCRVCVACRKALDYNHPDFRLLFPFVSQAGFKKNEKAADGADGEEEEEGQTLGDRYLQAFGKGATALLKDPYLSPPGLSASGEITRPQVEELVQDLSLPPWEAPCKVALIYEADRMNPEAANLLLKTLEEPPSYGRFLLVTSRPHQLLPTVRSRCQALTFTALPLSAVEAFLTGERKAGPPEARLAAALSEGSLRRALEFLDPAQEAIGHEALEILESLCDGKVLEGFSRAPGWAQGAGGREMKLLWAAVFLRYLARSQKGSEGASDDSLGGRLEALRLRLPAHFYEKAMPKISTALTLLEANVSAELVFSSLFAALSGPVRR